MGNTGYKSFANLELYYIDDGTPTGLDPKPNVVTDPDYIAPVLDTATCAPSTRYYSVEKKLSAKRNNCASGYSGSTVTLTSLPNQFFSTVSQADANAQADAWLAATVQSVANTSGTCELTYIPPTGGGGGAGGCFVEGTLITLPDGSKKAIEELQLDQMLLSAEIETLIDTNNASELYKWSSAYLSESRIISPITKISKKITNKTIVINDGLFEATPTHLQLIQRDGFWKFIPLGDILTGDNLYTIDSEIIPVTSVTINLEERTIYPLTLNPFHTYFANGILTHNFKQPID
ncbi:Hint domain-containing protein [Flavobacterium sp. JAS]|uniref:Hint domain-containing protein n=1 Tax=Flavobacterium sp. JAS TaxID=2897329 RepID=UPI001E4AC2F1|nr:Hint domain-containing protein [Flavobacterium sp. JAS]MCD0470494.1 Hint domain-containing protein [Flavobacterium sp. JAS]